MLLIKIARDDMQYNDPCILPVYCVIRTVFRWIKRTRREPLKPLARHQNQGNLYSVYRYKFRNLSDEINSTEWRIQSYMLDLCPISTNRITSFPMSILLMSLYSPTLYLHNPTLSPVSAFPEANGLSVPSRCLEIQLSIIVLVKRSIFLSCLIASSVYSTE